MNIFKRRAKVLRVKGLMEIQTKGKMATVPFYCSDQILSGRTFERMQRFGQSHHCTCVATLQRKRSWRTTLLEAHLRFGSMHTITCKHVGHGWMGREFIGREVEKNPSYTVWILRPEYEMSLQRLVFEDLVSS